MASTAQIELWHAEKVATQVTVLQAANGIHYAVWGETRISDTDLEQLVGAVPATLSGALERRAYFFVPLAIADTGVDPVPLLRAARARVGRLVPVVPPRGRPGPATAGHGVVTAWTRMVTAWSWHGHGVAAARPPAPAYHPTAHVLASQSGSASPAEPGRRADGPSRARRGVGVLGSRGPTRNR